MKKLTSLSIFFPAYNEEENIEKTINATLAVAPEVAEQFEIIVVDDASTDLTRKVVELIAQEEPRVRVVSHPRNLGYGSAVKTGIKSARYDYVFFTDSDCQFELSEIRELVQHAYDYDVVIGYRKERQDPRIRLINAKGWNVLNRLLFDLRVRDIDCAFKLMERETVQSLNLVSNGAMVSAELLIRLKQRGIQCKEVPVTHLPRLRGTATGAKPTVIARALMEMGKLFFRDLGEPTRNQISTFALIGIANTLLDMGVFFFLTQGLSIFEGNEIIAKAMSFSAGVISSFLLNSTFTFQADQYRSRGFLTFASVSLVGLLVNASAFAMVRLVGVGELPAVLAAAVCSFAVGFTLMKTWAFEPQTR